MKVSFDFDHTLKKHDSIQSLAKALISDGHDVMIITGRTEERNNVDLFDLAEKIGIKKANIFFAGKAENKVDYVKSKNVDIHFENNLDTVKQINDEISGSPAVCVGLKTNLPDVNK